MADEKGTDSSFPKEAPIDVMRSRCEVQQSCRRLRDYRSAIGIVYGVLSGDIIHGLLVGGAIGLIPAIPLILFAPLALIWEKFFEKN